MNDSQMSAKGSAAAGKDIFSPVMRAGLILTVVFTALAHGAVEPWSVFVYESITLLLLLTWATKIIMGKRFEINVPKIALPMAALLAIGLAQSVALTDGEGRWMSLSKNVEATRGAVTVLAFLLVSFIIAANFFQTRERLKGLAVFLVIYGLAMALFALVQHVSWNGKFYWLRPNTVSATPFGPFVNHNHFAGYMEMLIPLPIAMILTRAVRGEMRLLAGFAAVAMGIAAITSLSRGGMISLAAEMVFITFVCLGFARKNKAAQKGAAARAHTFRGISGRGRRRDSGGHTGGRLLDRGRRGNQSGHSRPVDRHADRDFSFKPRVGVERHLDHDESQSAARRRAGRIRDGIFDLQRERRVAEGAPGAQRLSASGGRLRHTGRIDRDMVYSYSFSRVPARRLLARPDDCGARARQRRGHVRVARSQRFRFQLAIAFECFAVSASYGRRVKRSCFGEQREHFKCSARRQARR